MGYEIQARMTPARRKWLERLEREVVADRPRGRVGYDCWYLKWSEWAFRDIHTGDLLSVEQARERYERYANHTEIVGERITDKGRAALRAALSE